MALLSDEFNDAVTHEPENNDDQGKAPPDESANIDYPWPHPQGPGHVPPIHNQQNEQQPNSHVADEFQRIDENVLGLQQNFNYQSSGLEHQLDAFDQIDAQRENRRQQFNTRSHEVQEHTTREILNSERPRDPFNQVAENKELSQHFNDRSKGSGR